MIERQLVSVRSKVLKVVRLGEMDADQTVDSVREAELLSNLHNEHIVKVNLARFHSWNRSCSSDCLVLREFSGERLLVHCHRVLRRWRSRSAHQRTEEKESTVGRESSGPMAGRNSHRCSIHAQIESVTS